VKPRRKDVSAKGAQPSAEAVFCPPVPLLNLDAGELEDEPEELYGLADLVHVACGGHAGDETSMARAVSASKQHKTLLGAHPSYPDRDGFGRRRMALTPAEVAAAVEGQCAELRRIAARWDQRVTSAKAHGALYHAANEELSLARACVDAIVRSLGCVWLVGPPRGALRDAAAEAGLRFLREGFADRRERPDGGLVPRGTPGAVIEEPRLAAERAAAMASSGEFDTICVHSDTCGALGIVSAVRAAMGPRAR
jgi:5-oxoprolinase (ATP-hydrolysing) subunit A